MEFVVKLFQWEDQGSDDFMKLEIRSVQGRIRSVHQYGPDWVTEISQKHSLKKVRLIVEPYVIKFFKSSRLVIYCEDYNNKLPMDWYVCLYFFDTSFSNLHVIL